MVYGIISYHRPDSQKTLDFLNKNGVQKERIILSLNDPEEMPIYEERYGDRAIIICEKKKNAAGNRNNIIEYVGSGERLILMDDDVKSIKKLFLEGPQGRVRNIPLGVFEKEAEEAFDFIEAVGSKMFGLYPVGNSMFMKGAYEKDGQYSLNMLFQGGCVGLITAKKMRFNEMVPVCDDYEFILRQIDLGYGVARINTLSAEKDADFSTGGGCYEAYKNGAREKALTKIAERYSHLCTLKADRSGLLMRKRRLE